MSRLDLESRLISAGSYRNDMTIFRKVIICVPSCSFCIIIPAVDAVIAVIKVPTGSDRAEGQHPPCGIVNIVSTDGCVVIVEDHAVRKLCGSVFPVIKAAAVGGCMVVADADAGADGEFTFIENPMVFIPFDF